MHGFCGFTGQVESKKNVLQKMTEMMSHKSSVSNGYYTDDQNENSVSIGYRCFNFDLSCDKPIYNEDKTLVLIVNGKIYNYISLRDQLIEKGHIFTAQSDSEVIIHGFEEWKEDLLLKLRGMFSFVIWNKNDNSLFIARDYFGIKPVYYTRLQDGRLIFASEIKCIIVHPDFTKEFNSSALDNYLSYQYSVPNQTFFKGLYCLPPAHFLKFKNGEISLHRYWEPLFKPNESMTLDQAVAEIDEVITDSVEMHSISNAKVGCFLSSGVDSSYVSSLFEGEKAFTVGFDNGSHYNEIEFAARLANKLGIQHYTKIIDDEEYWDSVSKIQYYLDQPLADPSCVALYFLSQLASEHVDVVLSGEGADELLGGYRIYHEPYSLSAYQKLPRWLRKTLAALVSLLPSFKGKSFIIRGSKTLEERFIGNAYMFTRHEKARLLKDIQATDPSELNFDIYEKTKGLHDVTRMQYLDINRWMVGDILLKADRMSAANSLELRVPFLDKEVFSVASRIPVKHLIAQGTTKYALRLAAARHIPEKCADKPKLGFPVPIRVWLKQEKYYNRVKSAFNSPASTNFFNTNELMRLLDEHYKGKRDNSRKIWTVYAFLLWYEVYFGDKQHLYMK
jgi:asparagine synthase (glutamine-hydrolysing)